VERVVGGATAEQALPLLIAVHGLGDTPENFLRVFDGFPEPARIVAPRGPYPWGEGAAWSTVMLADASPEALQAQLAEGSERVVALAEWLPGQRPTVGKPVITGFSQGGMVSFAVAARHPEAIAGAIPVAGWLPDGLVPPALAVVVPIRALHGEADDRLPLAATQQTVARLRAAGADVELKTYPGVGHTLTGPMRADLLRAFRGMRPPGGTPAP
jgi:phospholipase/carboxylesterase